MILLLPDEMVWLLMFIFSSCSVLVTSDEMVWFLIVISPSYPLFVASRWDGLVPNVSLHRFISLVLVTFLHVTSIFVASRRSSNPLLVPNASGNLSSNSPRLPWHTLSSPLLWWLSPYLPLAVSLRLLLLCLRYPTLSV